MELLAKKRTRRTVDLVPLSPLFPAIGLFYQLEAEKLKKTKSILQSCRLLGPGVSHY
jgi:hypothetical protein